MDKISIETAIRWHRESIQDLAAILEEDVPLSIYGYKDEAQVKAEITSYEEKIVELKGRLEKEVPHEK